VFMRHSRHPLRHRKDRTWTRMSWPNNVTRRWFPKHQQTRYEC
jgi:hypothetical protein